MANQVLLDEDDINAIYGWLNFYHKTCKASVEPFVRRVTITVDNSSGIGPAIKAECECGETKDLTDFNKW